MSLRDGLVDVRAVTGIEGAELTSKQASECDCAKTPEERERQRTLRLLSRSAKAVIARNSMGNRDNSSACP